MNFKSTNKPDARATRIIRIAIFPAILGVCVALFAPENILQLLPILQPGVDFMTTHLPFMGVRIARSNIPQVLAVTYLMGFFFLPMQMILLPYCWFRYANTALAFSSMSAQGLKMWKMRLVTYSLVVLMVFGITLNGDYNYMGIDPVNTRFGLAWIVGLGFTFWSFFWAAGLVLTFMTKADKESFYG